MATPLTAPAAQVASLADRLEDTLPQTQCTRCGFPDCRGYAEAMAAGEADINRCPPGGAEGIVRLSAITGRTVRPLDDERGREGPRALAVIDEDWCIGCTLCIKACPVDCIVGASKLMHTVMAPLCTGCELCVPVCPVDCIAMVPVTGARIGWAAWGEGEAAQARARYAFHRERVERERRENDERLAAKAAQKLADLETASAIADPEALARKRAVVEAAMQRARTQRGSGPAAGEGADTTVPGRPQEPAADATARPPRSRGRP